MKKRINLGNWYPSELIYDDFGDIHVASIDTGIDNGIPAVKPLLNKSRKIDSTITFGNILPFFDGSDDIGRVRSNNTKMIKVDGSVKIID